MTKSMNRDSCRQLFTRLEILPLQSQYTFSVLLFVAKNKDLYITNQEIHNITKRSYINLHPLVCNLTVFQKGAYYSGIQLFNHLLLKIKSITIEIKLFKPALKRFLTYIHFTQWRSTLVIIKNHGFWTGINETVRNSSLIILNCIVYNKSCILEIYFATKLCQAQSRMITNIYEKELLYIRCI